MGSPVGLTLGLGGVSELPQRSLEWELAPPVPLCLPCCGMGEGKIPSPSPPSPSVVGRRAGSRVISVTEVLPLTSRSTVENGVLHLPWAAQ